MYVVHDVVLNLSVYFREKLNFMDIHPLGLLIDLYEEGNSNKEGVEEVKCKEKLSMFQQCSELVPLEYFFTESKSRCLGESMKMKHNSMHLF